MRHLALAIAIGVVAFIAVLAIGFALLPREALKSRIAEQISGWTGRDVSVRGEPEISFFPRLAVTLRDVEIGGPTEMPDADLLSSDELTGTIRLLPLLIGRVEVETFRVLRPRIHLVRGTGKMRNWALDSGAAALQLAFSGDVPLGEFLVEDGTLVYEDRSAGQQERIEAIDISVDWNSIRQPFTANGRARWRGETLDLEVRAENPFDFLKRDPTPVQMSLRSAPAEIAFSGEASREHDIRLAGKLQISSPSLQRLAEWSGYALGQGLAQPLSLSGDAVFEGRALSVDRAELDLNGQRATGAVSLSVTSRPTLGGTLDFEALDLTPYLAAAVAPPAAGMEAWRQIRPATDWFGKMSADVRLSAASVAIGRLRLGATAATASLREGVLEMGIGEAILAGGRLAGDIAVADRPGPEGSTAQMQLRATGVVIGELAVPLGPAPHLGGTADVTTDLQSSGATLGEHLRSLTGRSTLLVRDGAMPDPGLAALAVGLEPAGGRPADPSGELARFSELTAALSFGQERATVQSARLAAATWEADLAGSIGLADGVVALTGHMRPVGGGPAAAPPQPIAIDGTVEAPVVRDGGLPN